MSVLPAPSRRTLTPGIPVSLPSLTPLLLASVNTAPEMSNTLAHAPAMNPTEVPWFVLTEVRMIPSLTVPAYVKVKFRLSGLFVPLLGCHSMPGSMFGSLFDVTPLPGDRSEEHTSELQS